MNPGKFTKLLTLQARQTVRGSEGGFSYSWSDVDTVWAEKLPTTGREFEAALAVRASISVVLRIYSYDGLDTAENRVLLDGKVHNLVHVAEDDLFGQYQLLYCEHTS